MSHLLGEARLQIENGADGTIRRDIFELCGYYYAQLVAENARHTALFEFAKMVLADPTKLASYVVDPADGTVKPK